jgi:hypothetical protein
MGSRKSGFRGPGSWLTCDGSHGGLFDCLHERAAHPRLIGLDDDVEIWAIVGGA